VLAGAALVVVEGVVGVQCVCLQHLVQVLNLGKGRVLRIGRAWWALAVVQLSIVIRTRRIDGRVVRVARRGFGVAGRHCRYMPMITRDEGDGAVVATPCSADLAKVSIDAPAPCFPSPDRLKLASLQTNKPGRVYVRPPRSPSDRLRQLPARRACSSRHLCAERARGTAGVERGKH
jgi:hypothetical protein